ncbi:hypothetical protein U9M48_004261, partial [Paspalum notatum var. saurae]
MDRSWMNKEKREPAYQDGVEQFLAFAYRDLPHESEILCPCKICKNRVHQSLDEIRTHLRCDGYTTWVHHGEHYDVPNNIINLPSIGVQSGTAIHDHGQGNDAMQDLLQAVFCRDDLYESLPSMSGGEEPVANVDVNLADDDSMCLHGWTQESFTSLLGILSTALPPEANLPKTYYEAKKIIHGLGLGYVKIHACPNDCMLFRGDTDKKDFCHVCKNSRWKEDKKNGSTAEQKRKKTPAKVLCYFPLIPRLLRLFSTMTCDGMMRATQKMGKLRHPADGEAWRDFDARYPNFAADAHNVRLGLASDSFNSFGNMSIKHSTWPVMLVPYNLPPWICMKQTSLLLSMIIPGPESPGNDIDIYLQPLIDELLELWVGVKTVDASSKKKFILRAALLWTITYLYGWSTSGRYGCPSYGPATKSFYLKKGKKMCYLGHRQWLLHEHIYRRQKSQFDGSTEAGTAPEKMSGTTVLKMLEDRVFVLGKKRCVARNKRNKNSGRKGKKEDQSNKKRKRGRGGNKSSNDNGNKKEKKPEDWLKK